MEAKIRWKDNRNIPHLDLCRPFAAHCIGYPMVTLGFGFKSYIGYRIRQRKQREVAKENEFYMQLLQQALPQDEVNGKGGGDEQAQTESVNGDSLNTSSTINLCKNTQQSQQQQHSKTSSSNGSIGMDHSHQHHQLNGNVNTSMGSGKQQNHKKNAEKENGCLHHHNNHIIENNHHPQEIIPNNAILSKSSNTTSSKAANHLNFNNLQSVKNTNTTSYQQIQNGIASPMKELNVNVSGKCSPYKNKSDDHNTYIASTNKKEYEKEKIIKDSNNYEDNSSSPQTSTDPPSQKVKAKSDKQHSQHQQYHQTHQPNTSANNNLSEKSKVCEQCQRLEQETKRIKSEVQAIKSLEQELRQKYENVKGCLQTKQKECEDMQKQ